jgi:hypothetical protein
MATQRDQLLDEIGRTDSAAVDESLIDATMALSPEERLRQNDRMICIVLLLREGWAAAKAGQDGRER